MVSGFVKLRRGIIEHLPKRLSPDEALTYILIILLADHRTGTWRGCSQAMSRVTGWSVRQCQLILKSLREKGYITGKPTTGRGQYRIRVVKYFQKANPGAPLASEGESRCALSPKKANGDATYQEVKQEEIHKKNPAQPRRGPLPPVSEEEQRRRIEARDRRFEKEEEARREIRIGTGPTVVGISGAIKKLAGKKSI
jgi:hypothetical protein